MKFDKLDEKKDNKDNSEILNYNKIQDRFKFHKLDLIYMPILQELNAYNKEIEGKKNKLINFTKLSLILKQDQ